MLLLVWEVSSFLITAGLLETQGGLCAISGFVSSDPRALVETHVSGRDRSVQRAREGESEMGGHVSEHSMQRQTQTLQERQRRAHSVDTRSVPAVRRIGLKRPHTHAAHKTFFFFQQKNHPPICGCDLSSPSY